MVVVVTMPCTISGGDAGGELIVFIVVVGIERIGGSIAEVLADCSMSRIVVVHVGVIGQFRTFDGVDGRATRCRMSLKMNPTRSFYATRVKLPYI